MTPVAEAFDTAAALRASYSLACQCNDFPWATCQDETKGYDNVLKCAKDVRDKCQAAKAKLPAPKATTPCGKDVESAVNTMVTATANMMGATVAWLEKNKSKLVGPLSRATLSDSCSDIPGCREGIPMGGPGTHEGYEKASFATVNTVECTKRVFQCGRDAKNVCFIGKAASRVGVACDGMENRTDDPLLVPSTGTPVR